MTQPTISPSGIAIDYEHPNRSILMPANGFMADYDYTLNPYQGCAFGCR